MHLVLAAGGGLLLATAFVDIVWTTLWPDRAAGPLSRVVAAGTWRVVRAAHGRRFQVLSLGGPLCLVTTVAMWIVAIWVGWILVYGADPASLSDTDGAGVSLPGRVYFVAYSMFTMGNGDFTPVGGRWQLVTALAVASGMVTVTLAVTYVLSVVRAVTVQRGFAASIVGLGRTPEEIVERAWNGEGFRDLDLPLDRLASQLDLLADQHLAFPVLHYYQPDREQHSTAVAVAVLHEAVAVLEHGVSVPYGNRPVLHGVRSSTDAYLRTLRSVFIDPAADAPRPCSMEVLGAAGVPVVTQSEFDDRVEALDARRRTLLGLVTVAGWDWPTART